MHTIHCMGAPHHVCMYFGEYVFSWHLPYIDANVNANMHVVKDQ